MAPRNVLTAEDRENATWKLNSLVLCRYLQSPADVYYEAKVINIKRDADDNFIYRVHYQGWNSRHDEDISEADAQLRFKAHTEKDAVLAKATIKQALQHSKKRPPSARPRSSADESDHARETLSPVAAGSDPYKRVYVTSGASALRQQQPQSNQSSVSSGKRASSVSVSAEPPSKRREVSSVSTAGLQFENVTLSDKLGGILKLDHMLVREMCFLPILPASCPIDKIIEKYSDYLQSKKPNTDDSDEKDDMVASVDANMEFALGLRDYFNVLLKSRFLYAFEREQHDSYLAELYKEEDPAEVHMSAHYGLPHLLRLIVRLPETLISSNIPCNVMTVAVMKYRSSVFIQFLHRHWAEMFNGSDYEPASLNYMTNATMQAPLSLVRKDDASADSGRGDSSNASDKSTTVLDFLSAGSNGSNKENEFHQRKSPAATSMEC